VLELANIPIQSVVWFGLIGTPFTVANLVGFGLFVLLLVQGAAYWAGKWRQMRTRARHLAGDRAFRVARAVDPVLLAAGLLVTGFAVARGPGWGNVPGFGFAVFAVLEYVNYFHVQLMHDTAADLRRLWRVGLRPSHLARDLARDPARSTPTDATS
jgi:hypothetical protein